MSQEVKASGRQGRDREGAVQRVDVVAACGVAVMVMAVGFVVGFRAHSEMLPAGGSGSDVLSIEGSFLVVLGTILAQNVGAALLAFSGAITFGVTTVASVFFTGAFVGATSEAVLGSIGTAQMLARTLPYLPFEMGGVLVIAGAGLLPLVILVRSQLLDRPRVSYFVALASGLRLLAVGGVLVTVGAVVEAALIVMRR